MVLTEQARIQTILNFWFQGIESERSKRWFSLNEALDQQIRDLFLSDWASATAGHLEAWEETPQGALAIIILLDQFSRNLFRDSPKAFAQDAQALAITLSMIDKGMDQSLSLIERVFVYLPLEHSENLAIQEQSILQYSRLLEMAPETEKKTHGGFLDYAEQHKKIIDQFGRYPHRNSTLGRESTAKELAFLQQA